MNRPSKELLTAPGIRYLEFYGPRMIRMFLFPKIMAFVMGGGLIIAVIVLALLDVMNGFYLFYYLLGSGGGLMLIVAIIVSIVLPNRRTYNHILELRDREATVELKEILYKPGTKANLAMLALIDLGEVKPEDFYWRGYGFRSEPSSKEHY